MHSGEGIISINYQFSSSQSRIFHQNPDVHLLNFLRTICKLQKKYSELEYINKEAIENYSRIVNMILDETENIKEVELLLKDKQRFGGKWRVIVPT
jgi:hypothetical protein